MTLTVAHDAEVNSVVDGMNYNVFLNDQEAAIKVIQDFVAERE
jgi:hypothetical protein